MRDYWHSRQKDARGKGSNWPVVNLRAVFSFVGLCRTQRKAATAEVGRGGDGAREREKAERWGDALRSVSGFMELCITDPPPWIAIRDHSFWFYSFCCPALPLPSPSSIPQTKVSELSLYVHVFTRAHARVLCVSARTPVNGVHQRCALTALSNFLIMSRCVAHDKDNKVESGPKHGRLGCLAPADLPIAPGNSCLNGDEWVEQWRDSSRSAHRRVDGDRVEHRRQLWCLVRL